MKGVNISNQAERIVMFFYFFNGEYIKPQDFWPAVLLDETGGTISFLAGRQVCKGYIFEIIIFRWVWSSMLGFVQVFPRLKEKSCKTFKIIEFQVKQNTLTFCLFFL